MNEQKMNYEHVLSPIKIGPMTLKNRVSFTPVWPSFATADGHVNRELIEWVSVSISTPSFSKILISSRQSEPSTVSFAPPL